MKRKLKQKTTENKKNKVTTDETETIEHIDETKDPFTELLSSLKSNKQILRKIIKNDEHTKEDIQVKMVESNSEEEQQESGTEEESESDDEETSTNKPSNIKDPFKVHFEQDLSEEIANKITSSKMSKTGVNNMTEERLCESYSYEDATNFKDLLVDMQLHRDDLFTESCMKVKLVEKWKIINKAKNNKKGSLSHLQEDLFKPIASYKDLFYYNRNFENGEEVRRTYCLHAVNHVLKTRARILKNNAKIMQANKDDKEMEDCRDQGLTRPKVLILVPFKDACLKIVQCVTKIALIAGTKGQVMQKKRFLEEFSQDESEVESTKANRPDDFKAIFHGDIDDCFRIGLSVSKNTIKLYAPFYSADILIASPLGLRTIIGSKGEKQDFDFLSSIEVLILDQADVFLMQNWEHVTHIFEHMHLLPKQSHDTDFSRVRMWTVNGWSKLYRQTLLFSSIQTPELQNIFNKCCHNYSGKVKMLLKNVPGSVQQIVSQIPQVYQRINCNLFTDCVDKRFNYFINKVLPDFKGQLSNNTAIFVPSYFDFVRIRNYFKKEELSFVQISEYSQRSNISRSRTSFHDKKKHFLLFTERFYFFYRYRIRGIRHIIFYDLPQYPLFYPEIINFMDTSSDNSMAVTCTVLYSKFDGYKLEAIVGSDRCKQMMTSYKDVHMVVTGS